MRSWYRVLIFCRPYILLLTTVTFLFCQTNKTGDQIQPGPQKNGDWGRGKITIQKTLEVQSPLS